MGERGRMVVISGPSGSGKSTICKRLLQDPRVCFSVSATTRKMRPGEVDGRDYHFLSVDEFRQRIARGEFIEHAEVYGNLYGTLRQPLEQAHRDGQALPARDRRAGRAAAQGAGRAGPVHLHRAAGLRGAAPPADQAQHRDARGARAAAAQGRGRVPRAREVRSRRRERRTRARGGRGARPDRARQAAWRKDAEHGQDPPRLRCFGRALQGLRSRQQAHAGRPPGARGADAAARPSSSARSSSRPSAASPRRWTSSASTRRGAMDHIELAKWGELLLVAPASAGLVARLAHGLADDLLGTVALALDAEGARASSVRR